MPAPGPAQALFCHMTARFRPSAVVHRAAQDPPTVPKSKSATGGAASPTPLDQKAPRPQALPVAQSSISATKKAVISMTCFNDRRRQQQHQAHQAHNHKGVSPGSPGGRGPRSHNSCTTHNVTPIIYTMAVTILIAFLLAAPLPQVMGAARSVFELLNGRTKDKQKEQRKQEEKRQKNIRQATFGNGLSEFFSTLSEVRCPGPPGLRCASQDW